MPTFGSDTGLAVKIRFLPEETRHAVFKLHKSATNADVSTRLKLIQPGSRDDVQHQFLSHANYADRWAFHCT